MSAMASLDLSRLRAAYASHSTTPHAVMQASLSRMTDPAVWISRVPDAVLLEQAAAANDVAVGGSAFCGEG